ncbi:hypothetical protein ACP3WJ_24035, partial [Salmonella enterica]|uniref:hypothetical protein n=1 Tax=Salmonella enterica TaxID=28901 RepID=UPI003CECD89F
VNAGKSALKIITDKLKAEGKPITGFGLGWGPSVDGEDLPFQVTSKEAYELSRDVPLMIGTVKNEFAVFMSASMNNASIEQV